MKILIYTPTHPEYGIKAQTRESIYRAMMAYDGAVDWHVSHNDNPQATGFENVTHQHNKARIMVLENDYDALLSIEADMIVPEHTIQALIDADADVVYGLYVWRVKQELRDRMPPRWNAYSDLTLWGGCSVVVDRTAARQLWGKTIEASGLGMGCTLIHRHVLQALRFRLHDGKPGWIAKEYAPEIARLSAWGVDVDLSRPRPGMVCDDWLLAMDVAHEGYLQKAHLGVVCGHIDGDEALWPDPTEELMYRVEALNGLSEPVSV